jgi:hypothetical protein
MTPYEVAPYTAETLRELIARKARTDRHTIADKRHLTYFEEYFDTIGARTIVVENDYTDRDYLEDFAGYYVRCFQQYERRCTRLHFFGSLFDEQEFSGLLAGSETVLTSDQLVQSYLGFIVVKPLPRTVIGRTCLSTYPPEGRREFPITRVYDANLFGLSLSVESLAFQEQDSVAAACATSALWSAFNGTGKQFQHHIPSPVEITKAATAHAPLNTRTFPNSGGLTLTQMADAIRSVGLEPYLISATDEHSLRSTLYAYLRGHIPVLLGIALPQGFHAVTVTGYSLGSNSPVPYRQSGFLLKAFRIDKLYAHDDQIGPFARMELLPGGMLSTSWLDRSTSQLMHAQPLAMLVPLYPKIRIPFETIFHSVCSFNSLVEEMRQHNVISLQAPLEWDIYLTEVNTLKSGLHDDTRLSGEYRRTILTLPMPRFIWRATGTIAGAPALDLLFDATDIEQGPSFVCVIAHDLLLGQVLRKVAQALVHAQRTSVRPDRHILAWLAQSAF